MLEPRHLTLLLLVAAATFLYAGTRLAWSGLAGLGRRRPLLRGAVLTGPLIVLAVWFTLIHRAGDAISLLASAAAIMLTLGLGVVGTSARAGEEASTPALRLVLPLAACLCLIGFTGLLRWEHAVFLSVIGGIMTWSLPPIVRVADEETADLRVGGLLLAVPLVLAGLWVCLLAIGATPGLLNLAVGKPAVVLIFVFAAIGLLASESHLGRPAAGAETVVGYVLGCLAVGIPAVIVLGRSLPYLHDPAPPAVVMPLHTWRIDSVLMTVIGAILLPVSLGRFGIGRVEGTLLILASFAYVVMTVGAGLRL